MALTPGDITQGWEKEDVTFVETTDGFDVFMSLGTTSSAWVSQHGLKLSTGTQDVQWVGGAAPMGDNPCHDRGGCAAGTRQRGIWGGGLQLFASIPASWDVCGLGGWAVTPG